MVIGTSTSGWSAIMHLVQADRLDGAVEPDLPPLDREAAGDAVSAMSRVETEP